SLALAAIAWVLPTSSCTAPRAPVRAAPPAAVAPMLSLDYVLAPVHGDAEVELAEAGKLRDQAASLRRAWLLLELKRPQAALDLCAEVLFAGDGPSPAAEALARYLRALAFDRLGQPERGQ